MQAYEKPGIFYLGRRVGGEALLYDARDLTTHAVCLGMTGSGKTGLGVALLEEAAIDGIPSLVIDPKGDMTNLLLTFPGLRAEEFRPWIDEGEAGRRGRTAEEEAEETAARWREGLAAWEEGPERIMRLRAAVDAAIYTPGGGGGGLPLSIFPSLRAPVGEVGGEGAGERVGAVVGGVMSLLGLEADPLRSREHILLSNIVEGAWAEGRDLTIAGLIEAVQRPSFDAVGVMPLESFYPAKERFTLAMRLNALVASPSFRAWTEGAPLDIGGLLYTPEGKPRVSVLSIAHLSDEERMRVVTVLLNEVVVWMRRQPGTTSLRALLYMDEISGYFPPTAMPPAKRPMLTLLKQARAFGLGVVLSTQNPVDLDYRGLGNIGTWFIGRLQTERDRERVIEGLRSAGGGGLSRGVLEARLGGLGKRIFLMRNVHEDEPVVFETRFCLSYLRGPLTPPQISRLMGLRGGTGLGGRGGTGGGEVGGGVGGGGGGGRGALVAGVRLHYADGRRGLDHWVTARFMVPCDGGGNPLWEGLERVADDFSGAGGEGGVGLLPAVGDWKARARYERALKVRLRSAAVLRLYILKGGGMISRPGESRADFTIRVRQHLREERDEAKEKLRKKYAGKEAMLRERERRALAKIENEKAQLSRQEMRTAVYFGTAALSVLLGRRAGALGRGATGLGGLGRRKKEQLDVRQAEENLAVVRGQLAALEAEAGEALAGLGERYDLGDPPIEVATIPPKAADLAVESLEAVWLGGGGKARVGG